VALELKNKLLEAGYGRPRHDRDAILGRCDAWRERIGPRIRDTSEFLGGLLASGRRILVEGQLGAMRDVDHGIYPFVTSSAPCAAGLCQGAGIPPTRVDEILGVVKAYSTCVGAGPMVTELTDAVGDRLREAGHEYGASTGRPRRCGWLDLPALRTSATLNGYTGLAVTRLDVLDGFSELRVCTAYEVDGERRDRAPATPLLARARPVWQTVPGWGTETSACRRVEDLPAHARAYVDRIAEVMEAPVRIISVGPGREQTIVASR
jgi:adenylosuccinate synthase